MTDHRSSARLLALLVGLALAVAVLEGVGHGALATPPLTSASALGHWAATVPPPVGAFAVLRLVALGLAWYALVTTGFGIVARLTRRAALIRVADLLALPPTRRLLATTMGVGLSLSSLPLVATPAGAAPAPVHRVIERAPGGTDAAGGRGPTVIERLPGPGETEPRPTRASTPAAVEPTWTVASGQHCWGITAHLLAQRLGRPATDDEIEPAWRGFVDANRDRFLDPANPDLILPGQTLLVPAALAAPPASASPAAAPPAGPTPPSRPGPSSDAGAAPSDVGTGSRRSEPSSTTAGGATTTRTPTTTTTPTSHTMPTSTTMPTRTTAPASAPAAPDLPPATLHRETPTTRSPSDTADLRRVDP